MKVVILNTVQRKPLSESKIRAFAIEVVRFMIVGGLAYIVDVGLSNLLLYGFLAIPPALPGSPVKAKVVSTIVSIIVAWLGNRLWTYGHRETGSTIRGFYLFVIVNLIGMVITILPLGVTWYLLELRDPVSYNVSTNIVGIALAMAFRFYAYRNFVFKNQSESNSNRVSMQ